MKCVNEARFKNIYICKNNEYKNLILNNYGKKHNLFLLAFMLIEHHCLFLKVVS